MEPHVEIREIDQSQTFPALENVNVFVGKFLTDVPVNKPIIITSKREFIDLFGDVDSLLHPEHFEEGIPRLKRKEPYKPTFECELVGDEYYKDPYEEKIEPGEVYHIFDCYHQVLDFLDQNRYVGLIVVRYDDNPMAAFDAINLEDEWVEMVFAVGETIDAAEMFANKKNIPVICSVDIPDDPQLFIKMAPTIIRDNVCFTIGEKTVYHHGVPRRISISGALCGMRANLINTKGVASTHCNQRVALDSKYIPLKAKKEIRNRIYDFRINYLTTFDKKITIMGENLGKHSLTDRLVINRIERTCELSMKYFVFEMNTEATRWAVYQNMKNILDISKTHGLIFDFKVVCDNTNNKNAKNEVYCDVYFKLRNRIETIQLNFIAQAVS